MNLIKRVQIMPRRYFSFGRSISYLPMKNAESDRVCCMIPISCGYLNIYQNIIICFKRYDRILKLWYTEGQPGKNISSTFTARDIKHAHLWLYIFGAGRNGALWWHTEARCKLDKRYVYCISVWQITSVFSHQNKSCLPDSSDHFE